MDGIINTLCFAFAMLVLGAFAIIALCILFVIGVILAPILIFWWAFL